MAPHPHFNQKTNPGFSQLFSLTEVNRASPTLIRGQYQTVRPHTRLTAGVHPMVLGGPPGNLETDPCRQLQPEHNLPGGQVLLESVPIDGQRHPREDAVNVGGVLAPLVEL
eukprot:TRINITY_DN38163_c0_g1_i1.p2 TRINITY_DN38163_c0_g1~~TRINITY_DN38163_c0_g1_i1.p2  ORF type:complete len:111 (+),score=6.05 TRINITY_DN38163_c0_g1_i1:575-907(+)